MKPTIMEQEKFVNRDESWLEFNSRVLEEAFDRGNPLLERVKFLSIFSSNLDEFFMVRVAGISQQTKSAVQKTYKNYYYVPSELLARITHRIRLLTGRQSQYFNNEILPELAKNGIVVASWSALTPSQKAYAEKIFRTEVQPVLTPVGIDPSHPFPLVPNLGLELLIRLSRMENGQERERFAILEAPGIIPRFIQIETHDGSLLYLPSEELIANHLSILFSGCTIHECAPFRVTRDMDFSIDEESIADLLTEMQIALQQKTQRSVVRLEVASGISRKSKSFLLDKLDVQSSQVYPVNGLLNLKALFQLTGIRKDPALLDHDMPPLPSPLCSDAESMFDIIRTRGPFIIHLPYETFNPVVRLLEEAADDPRVLAIKQTLYRVSGNSPVVNALIRAARNGKQVSVLFEIKARFDEANNIRLANALANAGAHVVYGVANLKVHCKALLVVRKEDDGIQRYVHLGTGNYNDKTAKLYTDIGYFSADRALAQDVASLFNVITGFSDPPLWNKLIVAPFNMREKLIFLIDREAEISSAENPGHITLKANAIIDFEIIEHLYRAAEHHVRIDMVIRGICGINLSALSPAARKNIRVVSILDRFLEHARIYVFRNNGYPEYYMGSADLMPRNIRRRIELFFPVDSTAIRAELDFILETELNDTRKGRRLSGVNSYSRPRNAAAIEKSRSQYALYDFYRKRLARVHDAEQPLKHKLKVYNGPQREEKPEE